MQRIRDLNLYQKGILLVLIVMALVFAFIYSTVISRVGFLYMDRILVPEDQNGTTVYSAEVGDEQWRFTVTPDKTVTFRCGEKEYGPYTVSEDPSAVPKNEYGSDHMIGIVVRDREEELFRGGLLYQNPDHTDFYLYDENGWYSGFTVTATMSNGTVVDSDGNIVDLMEPSVWTVLRLVFCPELTHKGIWSAWFGGVLLSIMAGVSILFADELFRFNLMFRVRDAELAEPSEWEIAGRYISWTVLPVVILVLYITGLQ